MRPSSAYLTITAPSFLLLYSAQFELDDSPRLRAAENRTRVRFRADLATLRHQRGTQVHDNLQQERRVTVTVDSTSAIILAMFDARFDSPYYFLSLQGLTQT